MASMAVLNSSEMSSLWASNSRMIRSARSANHLEDTGFPFLGSDRGFPFLGSDTGFPSLESDTGLPSLESDTGFPYLESDTGFS